MPPERSDTARSQSLSDDNGEGRGDAEPSEEAQQDGKSDESSQVIDVTNGAAAASEANKSEPASGPIYGPQPIPQFIPPDPPAPRASAPDGVGNEATKPMQGPPRPDPTMPGPTAPPPPQQPVPPQRPWAQLRRPRRAAPPRVKRERAEGRWINHRLRHVNPWSVFKLAGLFYACLALMLLVASVLLWSVGRRTETIDNFESFISRMAAYGRCVPQEDVPANADFEIVDNKCKQGEVVVDGFRFRDGVLFRAMFFFSIIFVVAATVLSVLLTVLFNLLNDVTGGLRYATVRETPGGPSPPAAQVRS